MTEAEEFLELLKRLANAPSPSSEEVERVRKILEADAARIDIDDREDLAAWDATTGDGIDDNSETPAQFKTHFDPSIPTNLSRVDFGEDDD